MPDRPDPRELAARLDNKEPNMQETLYRYMNEMPREEWRQLMLQVNRQERNGTGLDLEMYDSRGQKTTDESAAVQFRVVEPRRVKR